MLTLPKQFQSGFQREIRRFEEENQMLYVTSIERLARQEKGREAILEVLEVRFESVPEMLVESLNQIWDDSVLSSLHRQSITVDSIERFQELVNQQVPSQI